MVMLLPQLTSRRHKMTASLASWSWHCVGPEPTRAVCLMDDLQWYGATAYPRICLGCTRWVLVLIALPREDGHGVLIR
jgi:hypothetical protein